MALELVSDKTAKADLRRKITDRIFHEGVRRGLLTMSYSAHFRIQPPLTTDLATAMNGLATYNHRTTPSAVKSSPARDLNPSAPW